VSGTAVTFLGIIAVALLVMALVQIGAIVGLVLAGKRIGRLAGRVEALADRAERDFQPMVERLTAMSGEAARAAALAATQVERVDRMVTDVGQRLEHSAGAVQRALTAPAREGAALVAGVRAGVGTLREIRQRRRRSATTEGDDDAMFIG
jgi:hypothetical protein